MKVAVKYHTPRFILVPQLRTELEVPTPADRDPGGQWVPGPPVAAEPGPTEAARVIRVGYARTSTIAQELQSQLDALEAAGCAKIYSEQISTRVKVRPQFTAALDYVKDLKRVLGGAQQVLFTVHELKRLGRGSAELITTADTLRSHDVGLEMLTGPLAGVYDPRGYGAALFAFFAGMAESDREYTRERTLEGQEASRKAGRYGGRPAVIDTDMADYARTLRAKGVPVADIAAKLVIPSGKNKGKHPSLATVYRILGETTDTESTAA